MVVRCQHKNSKLPPWGRVLIAFCQKIFGPNSFTIEQLIPVALSRILKAEGSNVSSMLPAPDAGWYKKSTNISQILSNILNISKKVEVKKKLPCLLWLILRYHEKFSDKRKALLNECEEEQIWKGDLKEKEPQPSATLKRKIVEILDIEEEDERRRKIDSEFSLGFSSSLKTSDYLLPTTNAEQQSPVLDMTCNATNNTPNSCYVSNTNVAVPHQITPHTLYNHSYLQPKSIHNALQPSNTNTINAHYFVPKQQHNQNPHQQQFTCSSNTNNLPVHVSYGQHTFPDFVDDSGARHIHEVPISHPTYSQQYDYYSPNGYQQNISPVPTNIALIPQSHLQHDGGAQPQASIYANSMPNFPSYYSQQSQLVNSMPVPGVYAGPYSTAVPAPLPTLLNQQENQCHIYQPQTQQAFYPVASQPM